MALDEFFSENYDQAREKFRAACRRHGVDVATFEHPTERGPNGGSLTIDVAMFGRADAPNAALINTGTHGIEGFCGSAIVTQWIEHREFDRLADGVGALIIHAINPWGFDHLRRTTENNVDLNRNFVDHDEPYPENPRYAELHDLVCAREWSDAALADAQGGLDAYAEAHGRDTMMDALIRGQYSHADGMNYGGSQREWPNLMLENILGTYLGHARHVGFIDWHTGIGDSEELVFLCFNEEGGDLHRRVGDWWGAENVTRDAAFASAGRKRPNYKGLVFHGVEQFLPRAEMAGAVIEFGTRGSPAMYEALRLDRWLRFETDRWSPDNKDKLEDLFDAFCPRAQAWREGVLKTSLPVMRAMCEGLAEWE